MNFTGIPKTETLDLFFCYPPSDDQSDKGYCNCKTCGQLLAKWVELNRKIFNKQWEEAIKSAIALHMIASPKCIIYKAKRP